MIESNAGLVLNETFDTYTPGIRWTETKDTGDFIQLDGNAVGTYLVISKSPFNANTTTVLDSLTKFKMPFDFSLGFSMSQRTLGQELAVDFVDDSLIDNLQPDVNIVTMSQTASVLTVQTSVAHNYKPGYRIGIAGSAEDRLNYPALIVASVPTTTTFTVTAGPSGTIPSQTLGPITSGYVYMRPALGRAKNGVSVLFEAGTQSQASFYTRSFGGDVMMSGTALGNHSATMGSVASTQFINAPNAYALLPTNEIRLSMLPDKLQWSDVGIDSVTTASARHTRVQNVPDAIQNYRLRFRYINNKSLTVPAAQVVSAVKTGTTTATITTDRPHNLTVNDFVQIYGIRDQTNFANNISATQVASIVNSTTFTIVLGIAATATSYGGVVAVVQGNNLLGSLGYNASVASTVQSTSGIVTVIGNASWSGLVIGEYIELYGIRNDVNGATIGVDGTYRIRNVATTTLELEPINGTATVADFGPTNAGGCIIKRSDVKIYFLRGMKSGRNRIEVLTRPTGDTASAIPVAITSNPSVTISSTSSSVQALPNTTVNIVDLTSAAVTTTTTTTASTNIYPGIHEFVIPVTAVSGTSPTLDVGIEESGDGGTNWIRIYDFPRITGTGYYRSPPLMMKSGRVRYIQTIGGTTPSFTRSLSRNVSGFISQPIIRQLITRTLADTTTPGAATATLDIDGCTLLTAVIQVASFTTAATLSLDTSIDSANWTSIATATINGTGAVRIAPVMDMGRFARVSVQSAGASNVISNITIKGSA